MSAFDFERIGTPGRSEEVAFCRSCEGYVDADDLDDTSGVCVACGSRPASCHSCLSSVLRRDLDREEVCGACEPGELTTEQEVLP